MPVLAFPFVREKLKHGKNTRIVAVEPAACPTLTKGAFTWDWADAGCVAPICQMYTLGHSLCRRLSMPAGCAITVWLRT